MKNAKPHSELLTQPAFRLSFLFMLIVTFVTGLAGCNDASKSADHTDSLSVVKPAPMADTTATAREDKGFFYFQLNPTSSSAPIYFSDVKLISYSDNVDLGRKQDAYMQKLKDEAKKDGQDPANYNQQSSLEIDTRDEAVSERSSNIKSLRTAGKKVVEKTIAD